MNASAASRAFLLLGLAFVGSVSILASANAQNVGDACPQNGAYAAPSSAGQIIHCVSGAWVAVGQTNATGSTGQIQFANSGALGASSNFVWDNTNNRVGIGTASPTDMLDLNGGNIALLQPTAATSGTQQVASPILTLQSNVWNGSAAVLGIMTEQYTAGNVGNTGVLLFNMPTISGAWPPSVFTEVRFAGTAYMDAENTVDAQGAVFGELWNSAEFGLKNLSSGVEGIIPSGSAYQFLRMTQNGVVGTVQGSFGNIPFRNVLDDGSASARMGLGTITPQSKLDVYGGVSIGTSYAGVTAAPTNGAIIQGNVGIGTTLPAVALDASQKTDAIALPAGNTGQRPTCNAAAAGQIRYNSTNGVPEFCNGSAWNPFSGSCLAGSAGTDTSLASGLVAYWNFNEGSGNIVNDDTGNGNTGTWNGTLGGQWTTGKIGYGGNFTGSNYVLFSSGSSNYTNVTVSAWFKTSSNNEFILDAQNGNPLFYMQIGATTSGGNANKLTAYFRTNSGNVLVVSGATTVNDNNWHMGTIVRNVSTQKVYIYVDGNLDATANYTDTGSITAPLVFMGGTSGAYIFSGLIDEVGVWNAALTSTQISTLYNSGVGNAYGSNMFYCPSITTAPTSGGFAN